MLEKPEIKAVFHLRKGKRIQLFAGSFCAVKLVDRDDITREIHGDKRDLPIVIDRLADRVIRTGRKRFDHFRIRIVDQIKMVPVHMAVVLIDLLRFIKVAVIVIHRIIPLGCTLSHRPHKCNSVKIQFLHFLSSKTAGISTVASTSDPSFSIRQAPPCFSRISFAR